MGHSVDQRDFVRASLASILWLVATAPLFDHLSRLITVDSLKTRLAPSLDAMASAETGNETVTFAMFDGIEKMSLVSDSGKTIGWVGISQFAIDPLPETVGECAELLAPEDFVSSATNVLDAVFLFPEKNPWRLFFVLSGNEITGTLHLSDFAKLPFRLCLFSLTLELEQLALDLALTDPTASWGVLSAGRKAGATETLQKNLGPKAPVELDGRTGQLLAHTMFCDKGTVVQKMKFLPGFSGKQVEDLFGRAERVRNWCAHTGSNEMPAFTNAAAIRLFIHDIRRALEELRSQLEARADSV